MEWKRKEYYDNYGRFLFEGEDLEGKRWNGKQKIYDYDSKKYHEIKYFNGKCFEKGKIILYNFYVY